MYKLLDFRHNPAKFLNHSTTFDMLRRSSGRDTKTSEKTGVAASDLGRRVLSGCHAKLPRKRGVFFWEMLSQGAWHQVVEKLCSFFRKFQLNWEKSNT